MNHFWKCLVQWELPVESITHHDGKQQWPSQKYPSQWNNQGRTQRSGTSDRGVPIDFIIIPKAGDGWSVQLQEGKRKRGAGGEKQLTQSIAILSEGGFFPTSMKVIFIEDEFQRQSQHYLNAFFPNTLFSASMFSSSRMVMRLASLISLLCDAHLWPGHIFSVQTLYSTAQLIEIWGSHSWLKGFWKKWV